MKVRLVYAFNTTLNQLQLIQNSAFNFTKKLTSLLILAYSSVTVMKIVKYCHGLSPDCVVNTLPRYATCHWYTHLNAQTRQLTVLKHMTNPCGDMAKLNCLALVLPVIKIIIIISPLYTLLLIYLI